MMPGPSLQTVQGRKRVLYNKLVRGKNILRENVFGVTVVVGGGDTMRGRTTARVCRGRGNDAAGAAPPAGHRWRAGFAGLHASRALSLARFRACALD